MHQGKSLSKEGTDERFEFSGSKVTISLTTFVYKSRMEITLIRFFFNPIKMCNRGFSSQNLVLPTDGLADSVQGKMYYSLCITRFILTYTSCHSALKQTTLLTVRSILKMFRDT